MQKFILLILICLFKNAPCQLKTGDNLGNHKAIKDLDMSDQKIISASGIVLGAASYSNNSVQLELTAGNKALLINRVANINSIISPVDGMLVYSNTENKFYLRQAGTWVTFASMADLTWNNISGKPAFAAAAYTGNFSDLANKPFIPSNLSSLNNDAGYLTAQSTQEVIGKKYFISNFGNQYLMAASEPGLQAYSTDGSAAFMSFNRKGNFSLNMGLDPDSVFRWGGWSLGSKSILELDMRGMLTTKGYMFAQQFYQSSDKKLKNIYRSIKPPANALSITLKAYRFKSDPTASLHYGYIAQEVEKIIPTAIKNVAVLKKPVDINFIKQYNQVLTKQISTYEEHKEVNYLDVHSIMINELIAEIKKLKKEIALLKSKTK